MTEDIDSSRMPLLDHLVELRQRLIVSGIGLILAWGVCYYFGDTLTDFLIQPLVNELKKLGVDPRLVYTNLIGAFLVRIKVSFWTACFISFPIISGQIWMFVAPGLYKNERNAFLPYLVATPVLFLTGAALAYYVIFPAAFRFFLSFGQSAIAGGAAIQALPDLEQYLSLTLTLIFAFGLAFQMPVALTLMARVGLVSSGFLVRQRRYAIVLNFAAAALVTPPDALSMTGLALPLCILYEISIWSCRWVERQRAKREAALMK